MEIRDSCDCSFADTNPVCFARWRLPNVCLGKRIELGAPKRAEPKLLAGLPSLGRRSAALVVYFDLGLPDGVGYRFRPLVRALFHDHLLLHARLLAHDRLLGLFSRLNRALLEEVLFSGHSAVRGTTLDAHVLLAQVDLLLHGSLDNIAAHPDPALIDLALADIEPLFRNRYALLAIRADAPNLSGPGYAGRAEMLLRCIAAVPPLFTPGSRAIVDIDRALIVENVDDAIRLRFFRPDRDKGSATSNAFGVGMSVGLVDACSCESTDQSPCRGPGAGSEKSGRKPAGCHNGTQSRDCQHA